MNKPFLANPCNAYIRKFESIRFSHSWEEVSDEGPEVVLGLDSGDPKSLFNMASVAPSVHNSTRSLKTEGAMAC